MNDILAVNCMVIGLVALNYLLFSCNVFRHKLLREKEPRALLSISSSSIRCGREAITLYNASERAVKRIYMIDLRRVLSECGSWRIDYKNQNFPGLVNYVSAVYRKTP